MSEAATRDRASRQHWAVPGSRHDKLIRFAKIALPSSVGILVAFLALAPLDRSGDVSFILDKTKVENAPERMRVESARYVGEDDKGQKFALTAERAIQQSSDTPVVNIWGMLARLGLAQGPVLIQANKGRYNLDAQTIAIDGPVKVNGPDDYRIQTRDLTVNMKNRQALSDGPVEGSLSLGQFRADRLRADLEQRTIVLEGGARLKIVQGAVR
jgi:lipopolysaccharide export system protein LptC